MTTVVIGSNCFTGSHIVDALLERGDDVVGVSRSPEKAPLYLPYRNRDLRRFRFRRLDLVRETEALVAFLDELRPGVVVNVAALSEVNLSNFQPVEYFQTNTLGVVRLCRELRERKYLKRYVHISSAEVYGTCAAPVTEEAPFRPSTPYAVSKAAADQYLLTLARNFGFPVSFVRSTNVYGPHQQLFKIIPRAAIYIRMGKKIQLQGGGTSIKHFVHVRDVVRGLLRILEAGRPGEAYHFSTGNTLNVADVVRLVCRLMGVPFETAAEVVPDRVGQDARYWLDCSKSQRELGWQPREDFEAGVREVVDWVNAEWAAIQREPLDYVHKV